jgi:hypothetical protein
MPRGNGGQVSRASGNGNGVQVPRASGNGNRTTGQTPAATGNGNALQKVKNEANAERRRIESNAARARTNLEANARRVQNNLKQQLSGAKNANKALEIQARLEKNKINLETKKAAYDLGSIVKISKGESGTRGFLECVADDAIHHLLRHLTLHSNGPGFPALAHPDDARPHHDAGAARPLDGDPVVHRPRRGQAGKGHDGAANYIVDGELQGSARGLAYAL